MVQAEIDLRILEQRFRDRQHEMMACRLGQAAKSGSTSRFDVVARMQSFARHLRPSTSTTGAASATS